MSCIFNLLDSSPVNKYKKQTKHNQNKSYIVYVCVALA